MFKEMRRKERSADKSIAYRLLNSCDYGVLSTVGETDYPYGIPLNYVYMNSSIYFHSALDGHKLDNLKANDKVSFCVVGKTESIPERLTYKYESVVVFGKAKEVFSEEKHQALLALLDKYSNKFLKEKNMKYLNKTSDKTKVIKISIEHITGKAAN